MSHQLCQAQPIQAQLNADCEDSLIHYSSSNSQLHFITLGCSTNQNSEETTLVKNEVPGLAVLNKADETFTSQNIALLHLQYLY